MRPADDQRKVDEQRTDMPPDEVEARQTGTIDGFLGLLAGKAKKVATAEEMNEAAAAGWAEEEVGGGNVYADLDYPDAGTMQTKAPLVARISAAIEAQHWSPEQAAAALNMTPAELGNLLAGQFRAYSAEGLERLASRIDESQ